MLSRLFGLLSSSLLLYSQRFGRYALRPASGASCRTWELTFRTRELSCRNWEFSRNFEQDAPEEGRRAHWPKHCEYNNKDEDNSPNNLENTNNQASSQKFRKTIGKDVFSYE